jgi:hypothetical protein
MSVARAQEEISAAEFAEWAAYLNRIEPHGSVRGDIQAGIIAAAISNAMGGNRGKPVRAADFMPDFTPPPEIPRTMNLPDKVNAVMNELSRRMRKQK